MIVPADARAHDRGLQTEGKHITVSITESMVGHKLGEFAPTRTSDITEGRPAQPPLADPGGMMEVQGNGAG